MVQFKISYPHSYEFVNRKQIACPICNKLYMKYVEGVMLDIVSKPDSYNWELRDKYIPYGKDSMCSEKCATFYILSVMDGVQE